MATETRSRFNNLHVPGLFGVAKRSFRQYPQTWREFYSMRTSRRAYEESTYTSGFGYLFEKPEGTAVRTDARIQGPVKRWYHDTWALKCVISQEAIEDDLYGVMDRAMSELGISGAATRHLLAMRLIMNATATTYHTAGDGLAVASASHVRLGGGTWSNLASAADLNAPALEAALYNYEAITDHRGKKYDQKASILWCGPTLEMKADQLLGSTTDVTQTNPGVVNSITRRRKLRLVVDAEITDNRWGLLGPKDRDVGMIWFDRIKPSMSRHGDPDTGDAHFVIRGRWSNEVNDPRGLYFVPTFS